MTSDEIRSTYLEFFAERGHRLLPSASLVPASHDPSVLLTTAGMHPLKSYFLGQEDPPASRLTSCQKCFRTPDIDVVGTTTRHLTFFEMLGNFSMGDYFKQGAVEFAWEFSLQKLKFDPDRIWITVFEGDDDLGLGPDQEAIDAWLSVGVSRDRIVLCPRSENFWQAGPIGPCGPCSELYYDRGLEFGSADDLPGGENERFLEYWNLVFMQFNQEPANVLTPLPKQNIDTGMGLNRMALILQGTPSIFETDQFLPLIRLSEELSGRTYDADEATTRAMRILADHTRGMTALIADGVVPSNEDRGYVLRRIMRRAIQQGRSLGIEGDFLVTYAEKVTELMGSAYPELLERRDVIHRWLRAEEESFGRTLEQGTKLLEEIVARAKAQGEEGVGADDAFRLHDTFGFPFDLTREMAAERGLGVDEAGFEQLMDEQRARSAGGAKKAGKVGADVELVRSLSDAPTEFTGYEVLEQRTTVVALAESEGRTILKLAESPFYATGGGQIADLGTVASEDGSVVAKVTGVLRAGDDQALVVDVAPDTLRAGERVVARVDVSARHATQANHTATHLLHAALRQTLGDHVHQAGSYVGPDKLRFDFTHGSGMSAQEVAAVEDEVNRRVLENLPVRPLTTTLDEAKKLGAMALFGEKYGDVVRMVEIGDGSFSRELCGGTHVRSTAEIGVVKITTETSSAANVRRIEALTGPEAVAYFRRRDALFAETAAALRTEPERVLERVGALTDAAKKARKGDAGGQAVDTKLLAGRAVDVGGVPVLADVVEVNDAKALPTVVDHVKGHLGDAAILLGAVVDGRVTLVCSVAPSLVERGLKAGAIVKLAAGVVGGGGGGRDTMAQAGGKDPDKLPEAVAAGRAAIEDVLGR